jgi:hypothetical protein
MYNITTYKSSVVKISRKNCSTVSKRVKRVAPPPLPPAGETCPTENRVEAGPEIYGFIGGLIIWSGAHLAA